MESNDKLKKIYIKNFACCCFDDVFKLKTLILLIF